MKVRCKNCHWEKDVVEGELFCGRCGALLNAEPDAEADDDLEYDEVTLTTARDMPAVDHMDMPLGDDDATIRLPPPPPPAMKASHPARAPARPTAGSKPPPSPSGKTPLAASTSLHVAGNPATNQTGIGGGMHPPMGHGTAGGTSNLPAPHRPVGNAPAPHATTGRPETTSNAVGNAMTSHSATSHPVHRHIAAGNARTLRTPIANPAPPQIAANATPTSHGAASNVTAPVVVAGIPSAPHGTMNHSGAAHTAASDVSSAKATAAAASGSFSASLIECIPSEDDQFIEDYTADCTDSDEPTTSVAPMGNTATSPTATAAIARTDNAAPSSTIGHTPYGPVAVGDGAMTNPSPAKPPLGRASALPQALPPTRPTAPPHQASTKRPTNPLSYSPSRLGSLTPIESRTADADFLDVEELEETPLLPDSEVTSDPSPESFRQFLSTRPDAPKPLRRQRGRFPLTPLLVGAALGTGAILAVRYQTAQHADEQSAQAATYTVQQQASAASPRTEPGGDHMQAPARAEASANAQAPAATTLERGGAPTAEPSATGAIPANLVNVPSTTDSLAASDRTASRVSAARRLQEPTQERPTSGGGKPSNSAGRTGAPRTATSAGREGLANRAAPADSEEGPSIDEEAAREAMHEAAQLARGCKGEDSPTGNARVAVTFAPNGRAVAVSVVGGVFTGTIEGECIAAKFRSVQLPPFSGERVTLFGTVSIR